MSESPIKSPPPNDPLPALSAEQEFALRLIGSFYPDDTPKPKGIDKDILSSLVVLGLLKWRNGAVFSYWRLSVRGYAAFLALDQTASPGDALIEAVTPFIATYESFLQACYDGFDGDLWMWLHARVDRDVFADEYERLYQAFKGRSGA